MKVPLGVGEAVLVKIIEAVGALRPRLGQTMTNLNLSDVRIFVCLTPIKMQFSFDTLMGLAQEIFDQDPLSGHLFLFFNRKRDRIKILYWDVDGFCIWYKRLEVGAFQLPVATVCN